MNDLKSQIEGQGEKIKLVNAKIAEAKIKDHNLQAKHTAVKYLAENANKCQEKLMKMQSEIGPKHEEMK